MKTKTLSFSHILTTAALGGFILLGSLYASFAEAAQGCGFGYHRTYFGRCVPNNPGPNATPAPGRPDCWYNGRGFLRCWR